MNINSSPRFVVNLSEFQKQGVVELNNKHKTIQLVAKRALEFVATLFSCLGKALMLTIRHAPKTFRYMVLDNFLFSEKYLWKQLLGMAINIPLTVIKTAYWALSQGFVFLSTTVRLFRENKGTTPRDDLMYYAHRDLNLSHFNHAELDLDASSVPSSIQIDNLMQILETTNFDSSGNPGYMPESTRKETQLGTTKLYKPQELKQSLKAFIDNVKNRRPIVGAPRADDGPGLEAFYKQIEDAVRLSLSKLENAFEAFYQTHGRDVEQYSEAAITLYKGLLEDRSRIAIELAIAGDHCGGRHMGDAMTVYYNTCEMGAEVLKGTLHDSLISLLSHKRRSIVEVQINELGEGVNPHTYSLYLGSLGRLLGIPGTKNVTEALAAKFDKDGALKKFFNAYTVNEIISTVNGELKSSQTFREMLFDWLGNQLGDWKPNDYEDKKIALTESLQQVLKFEAPQQVTPDTLVLFGSMINGAFYEENILFPSMVLPWDDFVEELFALKQTKDWLQKNSNEQDTLKRRTLIHRMKEDCKSDKYKSEIQSLLRDRKPISLPQTSSISDIKVEQVLSVFRQQVGSSVERETIVRFLEEKLPLPDLVESQLALYTKREFLNTLDLEGLASDGLSPKIMEWLLVSQGILYPRHLEEDIEVIYRSELLGDHFEGISESIINPFVEDNRISVDTRNRALGLFNRIRIGTPWDELEEEAEAILPLLLNRTIPSDHLRFGSDPKSAVRRFLQMVIEVAVEKNPNGIRAALKPLQLKESLKNKVRNFWEIKVGGEIANIAKKPVFRVACIIAVVVAGVILGIVAYDLTIKFLAVRIFPVIISNTPKLLGFVLSVFSELGQLLARWRILNIVLLFLQPEVSFIRDWKEFYIFRKACVIARRALNFVNKAGEDFSFRASQRKNENSRRFNAQIGKLFESHLARAA